MSWKPWFSFTRSRRSPHRSGRRRANRRCTIRRLVPEILEDRRVLSAVPLISVGDVSLEEGDTGTTGFEFAISLSEASTQTVSVGFDIADGTATLADSDFAGASVTTTFQQGVDGYTGTHDTWLETDAPTVNHGNDASWEWDTSGEAHGLVRFADIYGTGPGQIPVGSTILAATFRYVSFGEGDIANVHGILVDWDESTATFNNFGPAPAVQSGVDFNATSIGTAASPGAGVQSVDVTPILQTSSADPSLNRGWIFVPTNTDGSDARSSEYGTVSERPILEVAYLAPVTFAPGQTNQTVTVNVIGDGNVEPDENFFVNLANPTNATIADGQGEGTIVNDDFISISDVSVVEGNSGTVNAVFTVSLSQPFGSTVRVDYATADGAGIQAAKAPGDYTPANGTITFAPGEVSKTVTVQVVGDTEPELTEEFFVNLSNSLVAGIGDGQGLGSITNDDGVLNTWTGAADGSSWGSAGNWDQNRVPDLTDDLVIIPDVSATTIINVVGNRTINRVSSAEPLRIFGGTLTLTTGTSAVTSIEVGRTGFGAGNLMINGEALSVNTMTQITGVVGGSGDLTMSGLYTWELGEMSGGGTTFANGGIDIVGDLSKTINGRTLVTGGASTFDDNGALQIGNGGELRNTGTFQAQSDANINNLGGAGTVINDGTFIKFGGGGITRINRSFTNNGIVNARSGELSFGTNLTNYNTGSNTLTGGT